MAQSSFRDNPTPAQVVQEFEARRDWAGLAALLEAAQPLLTRRAAARSLASRAGKPVAPQLAEALRSEPDRVVRRDIARALGNLGDDCALPALLEALQDPDLMVREEAAAALSRYNSPAAFDALVEGLVFGQGQKGSAWMVRRYAAQALGNLGDRRAVPALVAALRDPHALVPPAAALSLGQLGDRAALEPLKRARHATPHQRGAECTLCEAIDAALQTLR